MGTLILKILSTLELDVKKKTLSSSFTLHTFHIFKGGLHSPSVREICKTPVARRMLFRLSTRNTFTRHLINLYVREGTQIHVETALPRIQPRIEIFQFVTTTRRCNNVT